jgi:hypothetical protein
MDKKSQLINDIINLSRLEDEMYVYHPDNPNRIDVVEETEKIKKIIEDLSAQIDELDSTFES